LSSKTTTIWKAEPHTIAKVEMLGKYLRVWFEILGRTSGGRDLWYIDGFAGPGEYENYPNGSPVVAVKAADDALRVVGDRIGAVHCVFIEEKRDRFKHLQERLAREKYDASKIHCHTIRGTFVDGMTRLRASTPSPFSSSAPTFGFLDPFGPEGLPFALVKELLSRPTCEVMINLDSDGVGRILKAGEWAKHIERLNETFGDSSWESELHAGMPLHIAIVKVVELYKRKLFGLPGVRYCFSFEMRSGKNTFDYHLVFASQHKLGLEKMKEVMKGMDQTGTYCFSDGNVSQTLLFTEADEPAYIERVANRFAGLEVSYEDVNDFALNETGFIRAKQALTPLEKAGRIKVSTPCSDRKRFTYPDRAILGMKISFEEGPRNA